MLAASSCVAAKQLCYNFAALNMMQFKLLFFLKKNPEPASLSSAAVADEATASPVASGNIQGPECTTSPQSSGKFRMQHQHRHLMQCVTLSVVAATIHRQIVVSACFASLFCVDKFCHHEQMDHRAVDSLLTSCTLCKQLP